MGFMAGFGAAFSRSYEGARDRAAQEKQDAFRLTYQDYMNRQQQYDEWNREDAKAVSKAQSIANTYNLPDGAWQQVYSWVKSDYSNDDIDKMVRNGSWKTKENTPMTDKPATPDSIDTEMADSGMTPPQQAPMNTSPSNQQVEQRDTGLFGSLLGNLAQKGKKRTQNSFERQRAGALEQVAGASGRSVEEVQSVMSGYKPPTMPESNVQYVPGPASREYPDANDAYMELAQAEDAFSRAQTPENQERLRLAKINVKGLQDKAFIEAEADARAKGVSQSGEERTVWTNGKYQGSGRIVRNQDGSELIQFPGQAPRPLQEGEVALPMQKEELDLRATLNQGIAKANEELDTKRENTKAMFHHLNVMNETIRNTNGEVLKSGVASVTSKVEQWAVNIAAGANKISDAFGKSNGDTKVLPEGGMEQLLRAEQELLKADKNDLGSQKLLFDTQKALLAYRIGMSMGQEGRGLAEAERKLFMDTAASGWTVDQFYDGMANLVMPVVKSVDSQGQNVYGKAAKQFEQRYDYVPGEFEYSNLADELSANTDIAPMWAELQKRDRSGPATIIKTNPETGDPDAIPAGDIPIMATPEEAMKLKPGTKFRDSNGKIRIRP